MPLLSNLIVEVDKRSVIKHLGFKFPIRNHDQNIEKLVDEELEDSHWLIGSHALYERFPISIERGENVIIEGGFTISSRKLSTWLGESSSLAMMAVTVGYGIEKRASTLIGTGETTKRLIADAIGSVAVEELAGLVERSIRSEANSRAKKRFSCGYSDWSLSDQKKVIDLIRAERIGITVNQNFIMTPGKSITAVVGIY